jgi:hypothetical protein
MLLVDDSGANIIIEYVLNLAIMTVLFTVIILMYQSMMTQSNNSVMNEELKIYANDFSNRIVIFDRMVNLTVAQGGSVDNLETTFETPGTILGNAYNIKINGNSVEVYSADKYSSSVKAGFSTKYQVDTAFLTSASQSHTIRYVNGKIEVT